MHLQFPPRKACFQTTTNTHNPKHAARSLYRSLKQLLWVMYTCGCGHTPGELKSGERCPRCRSPFALLTSMSIITPAPHRGRPQPVRGRCDCSGCCCCCCGGEAAVAGSDAERQGKQAAHPACKRAPACRRLRASWLAVAAGCRPPAQG